MNIDLQKLTIKRLLSGQNHDFFTKLSPYFFSGANSSIYNKIESYYKANLKIPSEEEFYLINKDVNSQEYFENQIVASGKYTDIDKTIIFKCKYSVVVDNFLCPNNFCNPTTSIPFFKCMVA